MRKTVVTRVYMVQQFLPGEGVQRFFVVPWVTVWPVQPYFTPALDKGSREAGLCWAGGVWKAC